MSTKFYIKQNDTGPALVAVLKDADGVAVSLAGASGVAFHMSKLDGALVVSAAAVADANQTTNPGKVTYHWQDGDTANVGVHVAEFQVDFGGGLIETFPNDDDLQIVVTKEVA